MWLSGVQKELYARFSSDAVVTTDIRFIQDYLNVYCKEEKIADAEAKLLVQSAFRVCMEKVLAERVREKGVFIHNAEVCACITSLVFLMLQPDKIAPLVDVAIQAVLNSVSEPATPLLILEDALELQTIHQCGGIWEIMEHRRDVFMKPPFMTGKNTLASLTLLRIANGLLKRLSKSDDSEPVFCGRILMFLAYVFPISERSGVNSSGAFNTNPTPYETDPTSTTDGDADVDTDAASVPTDYGLYRTFWGVQDYLSSPQKIVASKEAWSIFVTSINTIAAAFDGQGVAVEGDVEEGEEAADVPATVAPSPIGDESNEFTTQPGDVEAATAGAIEEFYCTKYLTNPQLFNLQLRDPQLRRHVLLQFLIVFQLLTKGKKELFGPGAITMTSAMTAELEGLKSRVLACVAQTPPDGVRFKDAILHILNRETYWMKWKESGCPAVERPPVEAFTHQITGKVARKMPKSGLPLHWTALGSSVNLIAELEATAGKTAKRTLDMHLTDLQDALDPENCVDDEYNPVHNKAYVWRGLRLLAAEQLSSMVNVSGERFDQLMAKEGRLKLPEKKVDGGAADGSDEAFAAYMAAQAAALASDRPSGGDKKRPRPAEEPTDGAKPESAQQTEDGSKKGRGE